MTRNCVLSILLFNVALSATAAEHSTFTYKTIGERELLAHVVSPDGHSANAEAPALIFYHGGGFRVSSPQSGFSIGEELAKHGIVMIAIEYRFLTDPATMDQIIADGKSSVRWTRENAMMLGIDTNKIIASGHSAGGYLAAAVEMLPKFNEPTENIYVSSQPNAMVLWSPALLTTEERMRPRMPLNANLIDFQPDQHVSKDLPPTIFIHGTADDRVSPDVSINLNQKFVEASVDSELWLIEGADHFFREWEFRSQVADHILEFIRGLGYLN